MKIFGTILAAIFGLFVLVFAMGVIASAIFWFFWTCLGIGAKYFTFLPVQFHSIPFWDIFCLFVVVGTIGGLIFSNKSSK